jgi:hypothetical protein
VPKPYVFVYLPKTGSTPFLAHLGRQLVWNEGIVYLGAWGDRQRQRQARPDISFWSATKLSKVRVITGDDIGMSAHSVVGADAGRYLTVLRDPAEMAVADYNASLERGEEMPPFADWYEHRRVNQTTRRFCQLLGVESVDKVGELLRDFWFVTTTDHLDEDAPHLLEHIGVEGGWSGGRDLEGDLDDVDPDDTGEIAIVGGRPIAGLELTDDIRQRVYDDNPRDLRLIKLARKRRKSKRDKYGWS